MNTVEDDIRSQMDAFNEAFNTRDAAKLASLFTEDAEFVNIFGGWMRGRAGIEAGHAQAFASVLSRSTLATRAATVRLLAPGLALCQMEWQRGALAGTDASNLPPQDGIMTMVAAAQPGGDWLFIAAHNTQIAPPPGATAQPAATGGAAGR